MFSREVCLSSTYIGEKLNKEVGLNGRKMVKRTMYEIKVERPTLEDL